MTNELSYANETVDLRPSNEYTLHNKSFLSDISDSVCTEMVERQVRNNDLIESPPAFLMQDTGPPCVIYNQVIGQSLSFHTMQTSYSAEATVPCTVMESTGASNAQDMSATLSVIDEGNEAGIEVDYEYMPLSMRQVHAKRMNKFDQAAWKLEDAENAINAEIMGTKSEAANNVVASESQIFVGNNGKISKGSILNDNATKTSKGSRSRRRRSNTLKVGSVSNFFKRGSDEAYESSTEKSEPKTDSLQNIHSDVVVNDQLVEADATHFLWLGPEGEVELTYSENRSESSLHNISDAKEYDQHLNVAVDAIDLTYLEKEKASDVHKCGFEMSQSTSIPSATASLSANHNNKQAFCDAGLNDFQSMDVMTRNGKVADKTRRNDANEWGAKPILSLSLDYKDNTADLSDALSFATMDTKDLTDFSDNSTIKSQEAAVLEPKEDHMGLLAKMFACGISGMRCGDYQENVRLNDDASRRSKEEKIRKLTNDYEASIMKREDAAKFEYSDAAQVENARKLAIKSTVVAKTKVYPGFEVTESKRGESRVSTCSKSHAIKDMIKILKKRTKKNDTSKLEKDKRSEESNLSSTGRKQKTIMEKVNVHVFDVNGKLC